MLGLQTTPSNACNCCARVCPRVKAPRFQCHRCYYKEYRANNRQRIKEKQKAWWLCNKDNARQAQAKYEASSKGVARIKNRKRTLEYRQAALARASKFKAADPDRYRLTQRNYHAGRRQLGGKIEPLASLRRVYSECPKYLEVDHIIPIKHPDVCGLHVSWNMQYLSRSDNARKSNAFDGSYSNESWKHE